LTGFVLGCSLVGGSAAFAQPNVTLDSPYQVNFVTGLNTKDTRMTITNTGARGASAVDPTVGALCANVYAFNVTGSMIACCSCQIGPNALERLSVTLDVLDDPSPLPATVVLKALASAPVGNTCSASTPGALTSGMLAWKDRSATPDSSPFSPATLSAGELAKLTTQCGALEPTPRTCGGC
jgi:hypothetical protein